MSSERRRPVTEAEYIQGIETRVMPTDIKAFSEYIFRMLKPTHLYPPYASEFEGTVTDLAHVDDPYWQYKATILMPNLDLIVPMSEDGFIVTPNIGARRDESRHEGVIPIGYFVGEIALGSPDLTLAVPIPASLSLA